MNMNTTNYLLICLMEEAAELQQAAAKSLRFGLDNHHPDSTITNIQQLTLELKDIISICNLLADDGVLPPNWDEYIQCKKDRLKHWMNVSKDCGILEDVEASK